MYACTICLLLESDKPAPRKIRSTIRRHRSGIKCYENVPKIGTEEHGAVLSHITVSSSALPAMLPQYSKQYRPDDLEFEGDGSTQPFLSSSHKGSTEPESEPPVYPPAPPTLLEERGTVEYRYEPVYPRLGNARTAVGFMGKTMNVNPTHAPTGTQLRIKGYHSDCPEGIPGLGRD